MKTYNWENISLRKTKELFLLDSTSANTEFYYQAISILSDQDGYNIPLTEFVNEKEAIDNLFSDRIGNNIKRIYSISGVDYYLKYDLTDLTGGELLNIEKVLKQSKENEFGGIEQLMAILIRPAKTIKRNSFTVKQKINGKKRKEEVNVDEIELEPFSVETLPQRVELFLDNLTGKDVLEFRSFFLLVGIQFLINSLHSLNQAQN